MRILILILLISNICSCQQEITTKVYFGNNKYHIPAEIVNTKSFWSKQQIKDFSDNTYKRLRKDEGKICTIIMHNNSPYSIIYNDKNPVTGEIKDTIFDYKDLQLKYENLVNKFKSIKSKTEANLHKVYGYYINLGSCGHKYDGGFLTIITKDTNENYFMSSTYLCDGCETIFKPIVKTKEGFEIENRVWNGVNEPEIKAKEIFYENNGNLIAKDLNYVSKDDEKYVYYLIKMK